MSSVRILTRRGSHCVLCDLAILVWYPSASKEYTVRCGNGVSSARREYKPRRDAVDIADWLHGLGLGQYERVFRENAIDAETLPDLTEADLEKLGVLLGHRKRMLRSVAALATGEPLPVEAARPPSGRAEPPPLLVMFSDLVGSTQPSSPLHPDDLRA